MQSTHLIIFNYPVILSHPCSTTVSLETLPLYSHDACTYPQMHNCLVEINDMMLFSDSEEVRFHQRVPTVFIMTKMNICIKKIFQSEKFMNFKVIWVLQDVFSFIIFNNF